MSNTARLSLSSSVFSDRVKRFDSYENTHRKTHSSQRRKESSSRRVGHSLRTDRSNPLQRTSPRVKREYAHTRTPDASPPARVDSTRSSGLYSDTHKLALHAVGRTKNFQTSSHSERGTVHDYKTKIKRSKAYTGMYVAAAFVFLFASAVSVQTLIVNGQNKKQIENVLGENSFETTVDEQGVVEGSGSQPAEKAVSSSAISNYQVSNPEDPRYLRIPSLGVTSRIKQLGEKNGAIDAPWNINDVGWFKGSARPGNPNGSSLLLGHVSGWTAPGVFKTIDKLQPGEQFEVEKGSGEKIRYEVVRSESIPLDQINMGSILSSEIEGEHDLKLMTCSGKYNRDTETYEERMLVYAKVLAN